MAEFIDPDPDTIVEYFDDEAVLLSLRTEQFHALDPTATLLWRALETERSLSSTASAVASTCAVEAAVVRADLDRLVDDLSRRGLVRVRVS